jgi:MFS superfamily sulfate permease-like transporter
MLRNPANTASKSFAGASFVTMILAVLARTIDLIPTWFMSIWIVMVGLASIWMYVEGTQ